MIRIGIDIGGTFTDFVIFDSSDGTVKTFKVPSTPSDPAIAVIKGLGKIPGCAKSTIVHGSTVATNALLERKGSKTALVATKGFKDVIQIGRQNRPKLYDWWTDPPPSLVPAELRFEIDERVENTGTVSKPINAAHIDDLVKQLQEIAPESVGVCLLFSFLHPQHEQAIASQLEKAGYFVSISSEVLPEFREYERMSTTVVNAYVSPKLSHYLQHLQSDLPNNQLQIMQSNGGMMEISLAQKLGASCILSGPAGGIIGATHIANNHIDPHLASGSPVRIITFDMGGTSTDVSLIDGKPGFTREAIIGGMPIAIPLLDIHTIGAGGGSIATADAASALLVGPSSAGAYPGPVCYGVGDLPTVTDANLILGRIRPEFFLGGELPLDSERALHSLQELGRKLGLDAYELALGITEVVNAHMERAIRVISVEKGFDPHDFTLLTFGGAGGLHASDLAQRVGIPKIIIPPLAATLSAYGMLAADVIKDYSLTVMLPGNTDLSMLEQYINDLIQRGVYDLKKLDIPPHKIFIEPSIDMRYVGQSHELNIPFSTSLSDNFALSHQKSYGYNPENSPTEIVNVRVRAIGQVDKPQLHMQPFVGKDPTHAIIAEHKVTYRTGQKLIPFFQGEMLKPGNSIIGPAIILRSDTTIVVNVNDIVHVDGTQNIIIYTNT